VVTALQHGDQVGLILRLQPYYADLNMDRLDLVDTRGRVVARMEDPLSSGDSLAARPSIHAALQGRESCGVEQDPAPQSGGSAMRVTLPIFAGPGQVVGAVSIGRQLNSLFATEIVVQAKDAGLEGQPADEPKKEDAGKSALGKFHGKLVEFTSEYRKVQGRDPKAEAKKFHRIPKEFLTVSAAGESASAFSESVSAFVSSSWNVTSASCSSAIWI